MLTYHVTTITIYVTELTIYVMSLTIYVTGAIIICYQRPKSAFFDAKSWVISPLSNNHKSQYTDYQPLIKSLKKTGILPTNSKVF